MLQRMEKRSDVSLLRWGIPSYRRGYRMALRCAVVLLVHCVTSDTHGGAGDPPSPVTAVCTPVCAGPKSHGAPSRRRMPLPRAHAGCREARLLRNEARSSAEQALDAVYIPMRLRGGFKNVYGESLGEPGQCTNFSRGAADGPRFKGAPSELELTVVERLWPRVARICCPQCSEIHRPHSSRPLPHPTSR